MNGDASGVVYWDDGDSIGNFGFRQRESTYSLQCSYSAPNKKG